MAVCGRCLICGHKFHGDGHDEAIRWPCQRESCAEHIKSAMERWGEIYEHAICVGCHDGLTNDKAISETADALIALVNTRTLERIKRS